MNDPKWRKKYEDRRKREANVVKETTTKIVKSDRPIKRALLGRRGGKIVNLLKIQKNILPSRRGLTFTYRTQYPVSVTTPNPSATNFISLTSLYDPEYNNLGRNDIMGYYNKYMGATAGLYKSFKPYSATFKIKMIPTIETSMPLIVFTATNTGSADYAAGTNIFKIAERPGAKSRVLEYIGDTSFVTEKFKIYLNQIHGVTRDQYKNDSVFLKTYNATANDGPWLAISVGDSTGSAGTCTVMLQVEMKLRCIIQDPVPVQP